MKALAPELRSEKDFLLTKRHEKTTTIQNKIMAVFVSFMDCAEYPTKKSKEKPYNNIPNNSVFRR
jgi:hypothetical protein